MPFMTSHSGPSTMVLTPINLDILLQNNKCSGCDRRLNPDAKQPKDQALSCQKCGNSFHKKCTDRIQMRANWQRDPWFCQPCVRGISFPSATTNTPSAVSNFPAGARSVLQIEDDAIIEVSEGAATDSTENTTARLNPRAIEYYPESAPTQSAAGNTPPLLTEHIQPTPPNPSLIQVNRLPAPSNSTRQRSSNVNTNDPEREFLQTSVDSCRSTIVQQETELKKLKESAIIQN